MLSRRGVLKGLAGLALGVTGFASYAFAIEPRWRLVVTDYAVSPPGWPADLPLTIALVSDIHAGEPHMSLERITDIVDRTNALGADLVLLGGDFVASQRVILKGYHAREWAPLVGRLKAPLGVYTGLGNHAWWHGPAPDLPADGGRGTRDALVAAGIPVLENDVVALDHRGKRFWLAGLGDQIAYRRNGRVVGGVDDLKGTLAKVTDDAPVILLAHEPDIFLDEPAPRVALTLSGHTHGGQIRIFGYAPVVPSSHGKRLAYGHVVDGNRHLIVSGGLGTSIYPVRIGVPPEIVRIRLGGAAAT